MSSLDEIRKRLEKANNNSGGGNTASGAFYPFWNAPADSTVTLRFLPDSDTNNVYFWRERQMIRIPFKNVEGHPELSDIIVEVPCNKMYGKNESCPIQNETRAWWKTDKEDYARRYWPKKTYVYQGFVRSSPIDEENPPENPIRRFVINKTIHKLIEASLMDPDMEHVPTDYDAGSDFRVIKTQKGQYADYSTSTFARKESALTMEEREAIDKYGLFDLGSFIPKQPTQEELDIQYAMFAESLKEDSTFKLEWANVYKPKGVQLNVSAGTGTPTPTPTKSTTQEAEKPEPEESKAAPEPQVEKDSEEKESGGSSETNEILAQLRNRINSNG